MPPNLVASGIPMIVFLAIDLRDTDSEGFIVEDVEHVPPRERRVWPPKVVPDQRFGANQAVQGERCVDLLARYYSF